MNCPPPFRSTFFLLRMPDLVHRKEILFVHEKSTLLKSVCWSVDLLFLVSKCHKVSNFQDSFWKKQAPTKMFEIFYAERSRECQLLYSTEARTGCDTVLFSASFPISYIHLSSISRPHYPKKLHLPVVPTIFPPLKIGKKKNDFLTLASLTPVSSNETLGGGIASEASVPSPEAAAKGVVVFI